MFFYTIHQFDHKHLAQFTHLFLKQQIFCTAPVSIEFINSFKKLLKWTSWLRLLTDKSLVDQNLRHLVEFLQALKILRIQLSSSVTSLALKEIPDITT